MTFDEESKVLKFSSEGLDDEKARELKSFQIGVVLEDTY